MKLIKKVVISTGLEFSYFQKDDVILIEVNKLEK